MCGFGSALYDPQKKEVFFKKEINSHSILAHELRIEGTDIDEDKCFKIEIRFSEAKWIIDSYGEYNECNLKQTDKKIIDNWFYDYFGNKMLLMEAYFLLIEEKIQNKTKTSGGMWNPDNIESFYSTTSLPRPDNFEIFNSSWDNLLIEKDKNGKFKYNDDGMISMCILRFLTGTGFNKYWKSYWKMNK